jgi:hypothetical protein
MVTIMKEHPEPNYFITLTAADSSIDPRIGELLPGSYTIGVPTRSKSTASSRSR